MSLYTCDGTPEGAAKCLVCGPGIKQAARIQALQEELMESKALLGQYQPLNEYYGPAGLRAVSELIAERDHWKYECEGLSLEGRQGELEQANVGLATDVLKLQERVRELELAMDPEVRKFLDLASAFHHAEDELVKAKAERDRYREALERVKERASKGMAGWCYTEADQALNGTA